MAFDKPVRNRGKFDPSRPLVAVVAVRGMVKGDLASHRGTRSRRAEWWRRGWVTYAEESDQVEEVQKTLPAPEPEQKAPAETETPEPETLQVGPKPVSAEEGKQGWWLITFDDDSKKKVRRSVVEELGLLDDETEE